MLVKNAGVFLSLVPLHTCSTGGREREMGGGGCRKNRDGCKNGNMAGWMTDTWIHGWTDTKTKRILTMETEDV